LGLEYTPLDPELLTNRGVAALRRGQVEKARKLFQTALHSDNNCAQAYVNLGFIVLEYDNAPARAAQLYQRALEVNPRYPAARLDLALSLERQKDLVGASRQYRLLIAVAPGAAEPHFHLGRMALLQHRTRDAVAPLQRAVELRPDYPEAWALLALTFQDLGRFEEAKDALRACRDLSSEKACAEVLPGAPGPVL
jgi:Flp pilus assembly protein TadD